MSRFKIKDLSFALRVLRRETRKYRRPIVSLIASRSRKDPFLILISCILSLRTQDRTTAVATKRLFALASTPRAVQKLSKKRIERAIYPVGF
ncbi:MAG: endonuclease III, partial [Candidatus Omnitrophica bacterium]|nr:endonuclease III [Candidatus Omnitrophota bacterium]